MAGTAERVRYGTGIASVGTVETRSPSITRAKMPRGLYALLLLALVSLVGAEGVADKFRVSLRVYFRAFWCVVMLCLSSVGIC